LEGCCSWGEEEKKLSIFQRNVYLNSFLAHDVEKRQLKLKYLEKMLMLFRNAVAVVLRKNFPSNRLRVKLTFTAC